MKAQRPPATDLRRAKHGRANQVSYESRERAQRDALVRRLNTERAASRARGARALSHKKQSTTGENAGTIGGARTQASLGSSWLRAMGQ